MFGLNELSGTSPPAAKVEVDGAQHAKAGPNAIKFERLFHVVDGKRAVREEHSELPPITAPPKPAFVESR